jgi:hypothetical protein
MKTDNHELIDGLLPWFVNDTLEAGEEERVRRHLDNCEECRANVSLLSVVRSTVRRPTATPIVPPPHTDNFLKTIDGSDNGSKRPRPLTIAILAASLAAVLLVVVLLLPDHENAVTPPARYETATSTARQVSMDYVFNLQFESGTPPAVQGRVLRGLEARDIGQGETNGMYRVTVNLTAASLEELEQYMRDIESKPEIKSVSIVALQLPVKRQQ